MTRLATLTAVLMTAAPLSACASLQIDGSDILQPPAQYAGEPSIKVPVLAVPYDKIAAACPDNSVNPLSKGDRVEGCLLMIAGHPVAYVVPQVGTFGITQAFQDRTISHEKGHEKQREAGLPNWWEHDNWTF